MRKKALAVEAFNLGLVDHSIFAFFAIPMGNTSKDVLKKISMLKSKTSDRFNLRGRLSKLQNQVENDFVNANSSVEGIANTLADSYLLKGTPT